MFIKGIQPAGFPGVSVGKEFTRSTGDAGDLSLIPGSGRSHGGGQGKRLESPKDRGAWWATVHEVTKNHDKL